MTTGTGTGTLAVTANSDDVAKGAFGVTIDSNGEAVAFWIAAGCCRARRGSRGRIFDSPIVDGGNCTYND